MIKIIIGIVFIVGGLSGNLVLIGTNSGGALAAFGAVLIVWGIINMVRRSKQRSGGTNQPPPPTTPGT